MTEAEGRKFGLAVGTAFLVLTGILWWRGRSGAAAVTGTLGILLILAGLAIPGRLGPVHRAWMGMALAISKVTTPVFMSIVYFLVIMPVGILRRVVSRSPLKRVGDDSYWVDRTTSRRGSMRQQF